MTTRVKLKPGQKGTKKLLARYGESLFCVRYRYDVEKRKRMKTVEIIVEEEDWTPPPAKYQESTLVPMRIGFKEKALQEKAKALGARWDPEQKLWFVRYGCISGTALEKLIVL
jgi:Domain of unknown function (DUF5710)